MRFSVVLTTRRKIESLAPLFITSIPDAEIIIIDTNYNEETKKQLKKLEHNYYKVTYAPPMESKFEKFSMGSMSYPAWKRDLVRCHNTGFLYAENDWIVKVDDCTEFKPDFFVKLTEAINGLTKYYKNTKFVVRPVKLEEWSKHKKWEYPLAKYLKERFTNIGRAGLGNNFFTTLDQVAFPTESIDSLNGNDERYDLGHGYEDSDLMQRYITLGYKIIIDKELMSYQTGHWTKTDPIDFSRVLFEMTRLEIICGRYWAYNPYNLKKLRPDMLKKKEEYVI